MLSDSWKSDLKMVMEDPQKILQKSLINIKLSGFFSFFSEALPSILPTF